jgi:clan AA aspartic protease
LANEETGTFTVRLEIGDPQGRHWETVDALVDTGASFSVFPRSVLERLAVTPQEQAPFQLADGRSIQCDVAQTQVKIDGRTRITVVVFGDPGADALLGAYTLEGFLLAPDPVNRRLIPVSGLLKSTSARARG